jgi:hypothetical protein
MKKYKNPERVFQDYIKSLAEIELVGSILDITSNPLLYSRKFLPEEKPEFRFLESRKKRLTYTINLLSFPFLILFKTVIHYLVINARNRNANQINSGNETFDYIFMSHLVDPPTNGVIEDKFLGVISRHIAFKNKTLALFIPHFYPGRKPAPLFGDHTAKLLTRTTNSNRLVTVIVENSIQAINLYRAAWTPKTIDINSRLLLVKAAHRQINRDCLFDHIIADNCAEFVTRHRPKIFFMTYEGHTFEITTIKKLKNLFPQLIIMAYQHAPIVNSQSGFFRGLKFFTQNVYLLTSGDLTAQIATMARSEISRNVKVLGSDKYLLWEEVDNKHKNNKDFTVLLVPEASGAAVSELIELTQRVFREMPIQFCIRLHPRMKIGGLSQELTEEIGRIGVSSNQELQTDIRNAQACSYRSSAAALQAMQIGLLPIFMSHYPNSLLDPLYLVGQLAKYGALYEWIQIQSTSHKSNIFCDEKQNLVREVGLNYFAEENQETIEWILRF